MAVLKFASVKRTVFHVHIGKIAILKQAIFEVCGEKRFIALEEFGSSDFAIQELYVLQAAAIQFDKAEIAI